MTTRNSNGGVASNSTPENSLIAPTNRRAKQKQTAPQPKPLKELETEQAALGAMLTAPESASRARELLTTSEFDNATNRRVFEAFLIVLESGAVLDFVTAGAQLREIGEDGVDTEYLRALVEACPGFGIASFEGYAARLRELSARRRRIEITRALGDIAETGAGEDWLRAFAEIGDREARAIAKARPRFKPLSLSEVEAREPLPSFIEGVAPSGCLFGLVGPFGSGKSFVALDWALCSATGRDWQGRAVKPGAVVYITPEGTEAFGKRSRAWRIARGDDGAPVPTPGNFHLIAEAPLLMLPGDVEELLRVIQSLPETPALIVIDTVARHMTGGDENSQRDMGLFIAGADRLRAATGATLLLIHHTGTNGKMRGSTALPGALDAFAEVTKTAEKRLKIKSGKAKDAAPFDEIGLEASVVEIGPDAKGRPLTSLIFDTDPNGPQSAPLSEKAEKLLESLPETGASYSDWKKLAIDAGLAAGSFDRLKKELLIKHVSQNSYSGSYQKQDNHQPSNNHQTAIMTAPANPESQLPSSPSHSFRSDGDGDGNSDGSGGAKAEQPKRKRKTKNSADSEPYKSV